jgi:glycerophosphoryl diester phosphodiesterase
LHDGSSGRHIKPGKRIYQVKQVNFILILILSLAWINGPVFAQKFDWEGHRGARGLMPENSLPAFHKALELSVTTLEMDVTITKDKKVIVSHEPWMSPSICLDSAGNDIQAENGMKFNLYQMTYEEISQYDCGSKDYFSFPSQEKIAVNKPLLSDVFRLAEKYCRDYNRNLPYYNIEIKSQVEWDEVFHPGISEYCNLVYNVINDFVPVERVIIQSFDIRALNYFHNTYPKVKLSFLVENDGSPSKAIKILGFNPSVYSPDFHSLKPEDVQWLHSNMIKVVPWTVNDTEEMKRLIDMGVDGIITDYPDRIIAGAGKPKK